MCVVGMPSLVIAAEPVAVTRHGRTVGWFIPTSVERDAEVMSLREAASPLDSLLAERGVDPDEVVAEFKAARRAG